MQAFTHFSSSSQRRAARNLANEGLAILSKHYHDGLPISEIDKILTANGFNAMEEAIYCGRDGRVHEPVGEQHLDFFLLAQNGSVWTLRSHSLRELTEVICEPLL